MRSVLTPALGETTAGRARIDAITARMLTALTALGPIADTPAGQQQAMAVTDAALADAGRGVANGQADMSSTAAQLAALVARYARDSAQATRASDNQASNIASPGGGPPSTRPTGTVGQWIDEALRVLAANGVDTSRIDPAHIAAIIQHESSGNPQAINLWDSNAAAGHPSKGLMQTIDSTFAAYKVPGYDDIWDPVANIAAGTSYAIAQYGSVANVPGIRGLVDGTGYVGY